MGFVIGRFSGASKPGWIHSGSTAAALFPGPESTAEEAKKAEGRSLAAAASSLPAVLTTILLPPALMMSRSLADAFSGSCCNTLCKESVRNS